MRLVLLELGLQDREVFQRPVRWLHVERGLQWRRQVLERRVRFVLVELGLQPRKLQQR